jgi:SecD/SecF fusion protein
VVATTMSLLGILVYLWVRFGSIRYAAGAIIALVHDVIISLGALALSQVIAGSTVASFLLIDGFRIDLDVVAALLTIIGYSVNDTIVILDRIRENRGKLRLATPAIVNASINQTLSRTFLTSGTVMMSVIVLYAIGGPGLRGLSFCLIVGLISGTYSTLAIAAPLVIRADEGPRVEPKVPATPHKAALEKPEPAGTTVPA